MKQMVKVAVKQCFSAL